MIRDATEADAEAVSAVFLESALKAWAYLGDAFGPDDSPVALWRERIAAVTAPARFLVRERDDAVDGFVWLRPSEDGDAATGTGEIECFYTRPGVWGTGVGRELLGRAEQLLREADFGEATLWTEERNIRARAVYAKAGWAEDGAVRERTFKESLIRELRHRKTL